MPKRWRITSGSKFGVDLVDEDSGKVVARSVGKEWKDEDAVDDLVEEFREAKIEFTNGDLKPPKKDRSPG
jgi:hypothetical protein